MKKIVIFDNIAQRFVKSLSAYPATKELFCETPDAAYDFKSIESAKSWTDQDGRQSLSVLTLVG